MRRITVFELWNSLTRIQACTQLLRDKSIIQSDEYLLALINGILACVVRVDVILNLDSNLEQAEIRVSDIQAREMRVPLSVVRGYSRLVQESSVIENDADMLLLANGVVAGVMRLYEVVGVVW